MTRNLLLLILLTGCAATGNENRELTTHVSENITKAVDRFVTPSRIVRSKDGTRRYEWEQTRGYSVNASVMGLPIPKGKGRQCTRVLVVDRQRVVTAHTLMGKC